MHCHHEKLVIVDDEIAFVGGIDLTALAGDRYDTNEHPSRTRSAGTTRRRCCAGRSCATSPRTSPCAGRRSAGEALAVPEPLPPAGDTTVQFVRTVPEGAYHVLPRGEFSILESYIRALRSAKRLIYLENQFLWSPEIVRHPGDKLRHPPTRLPHGRPAPAPANNGQDDTRGMLGRLVEADDGRKHFLAATIVSRSGERSGPLYVHAKIGIVDDALAGDRHRQPQRALAVQRHRGRRRHVGPRAGPRARARSCGRSTSNVSERRRRPGAAVRRGGARSRPSSSSAAAQGAP